MYAHEYCYEIARRRWTHMLRAILRVDTFTMGGGGVNIAITDLPAQFPGSQASVASDIVSNQLGNTVQHSIGISQGNKGVACYSPLSAGPGESLADVRVASNTLGLGENAPIGPYIMENASFIVQVSSSLLPSTPCSGRPCEHSQYPGHNPFPTTPSSITPKVNITSTARLERQSSPGPADLPKGPMAKRLLYHFLCLAINPRHILR